MPFARSAFARVGAGAILAGVVAALPSIAEAQATRTAGSEPAVDASADVPENPDSVLLSLGGTVWTGRFGSDARTTIAAGLATARFQTGRLRLSAILPLMRIDSQGAVFTGIDGAPLIVAPGAIVTKRRREGVGDVTLGATYLLVDGAQHGLDLEAGGRVKLPIASSSSGLSTRKTDYAASVSASAPMGRFSPLATVTYRVFGDPDAWRIRDGLAVSAGGTYRAGGSVVLLASYDYARRTSDFIRDSHELVFGASSPVGRRFRVSSFASAGLSSGAAAFSTGASLSLRLGR